MELFRISRVLIGFLFVTACAEEPGLDAVQYLDFSKNDYAITSAKTSGDGVIVGGYTNSIRGNFDFLLMKFNSDGAIQWSKTVGDSGVDKCYGILQTHDGGFVAVGTLAVTSGNRDMYVFKTDSRGRKLWAQNFGGRYNEEGRALIESKDGSLYVMGSTASFGAGFQDVFLVKLTGSGSLLWQKTFGGLYPDFGQDIKQTADGGFIISGMTSDGISPFHLMLLRLNSSGDQQWMKTYELGVLSEGRSVVELPNGGFFTVGRTRLSPFSSTINMVGLRTDAAGQRVWYSTLGPPGEANKVILSEGKLLIAGVADEVPPHAYLQKRDPNAGVIWEKSYGGDRYTLGYSIQSTRRGCVLVGSVQTLPNGGLDVYMLQLDRDGAKL